MHHLPAGFSMRVASVADFTRIRAFYDQLIDDMASLPHHPMWDKDGHPADSYLRSALETGEMWVAEDAAGIAGALVVNHAANEGYRAVPWQVEAADGEYSIVHAFGVATRCRGLGLGTAMMRHIMTLARKAGEKAMRLDLIDLNLPAERVYLGLGFYHCASVRLFYEEVGWQLFHMYECRL